MVRYLASLNLSRVVLWSYLCWYLAIVSLYFNASLALWFSSVGMSLIIGTALVLSTTSSARRPQGWTVFRLYLMPFCVSSYSALTVGKKFILIFPPRWSENAIGFSACGAFVLLHLGSKYVNRVRIDRAGGV